jgi:hypothetical protein
MSHGGVPEYLLSQASPPESAKVSVMDMDHRGWDATRKRPYQDLLCAGTKATLKGRSHQRQNGTSVRPVLSLTE